MFITLPAPSTVTPLSTSPPPSEVQFMVPLIVNVPAPPSLPPDRLRIVLVLLLLVALRVRVFPPIEKVCVPLAPPTVRPSTVALTFKLTAYVPLLTMKTLSFGPGTAPVFQLAAVLQLPPAVLVQ